LLIVVVVVVAVTEKKVNRLVAGFWSEGEGVCATLLYFNMNFSQFDN
jgi:hypothetical protein